MGGTTKGWVTAKRESSCRIDDVRRRKHYGRSRSFQGGVRGHGTGKREQVLVIKVGLKSPWAWEGAGGKVGQCC